MSRAVALGVMILSVVAAFVAGRMTAAPSVEVVRAASVVEPPGVRDQPSMPPTDLATCRDQLALAVGILEAQGRERTGTPVPFPADLPRQYKPEGFESAVREALAACPDAGVALTHVDCTEFPCMAFFSQPSATYNHGVDRLQECSSWSDRFEASGQANSRFMTDEGRREYSMLSPRPSGGASDENDGKRWQARLQQGEDELMAAWGGRELTELEQLDEQIAFWNEFGGEDESTQQMMEGLELKRRELLAEQTP